MKPFKTHKQQINILRGRGLNISKGYQGSKVMRTLERENYYNVINGYKAPFLKRDNNNNEEYTEKYVEDTKFDEIYSLFKLDRKLRALLLEYLLLVETHLKSAISYEFTKKFNKANSYLDIKNYTSNQDKIISVVSTISTLSGIIKRNVNKNSYIGSDLNSMEHYLKNHQEVPLWVLINYLSLGDLCYFYDSLDDKLRQKIADVFSFRFKIEKQHHIRIGVNDISGLLHLIRKFRNVCAHEERLYDFKTGSPKMSRYIKEYNRENHLNITQYEVSQGNIFTLLFILRFYLNKHDYLKLLNKLKDIFNCHSCDFSEESYKFILKKTGLEYIKFLKLEKFNTQKH